MVERRSFALFDIDNTIYNGFVIFDLSLAQQREELLAQRVIDQLSNDTDQYAKGLIQYEEYADQAMRHWAEGLTKKPVNKVAIHAQEFIKNNKGNFFNYFGVITELLRDTHDIYLVTAEPQFVCQAISKIFPVTGFVSSEFHAGKGHFSGTAQVLATSQDKNTAIDLLLKNHALESSFAFGDASSDEDMLERAAYKICIDHSNSTLRDIALKKGEEKGWSVLNPANATRRVSELLKK